MTQERDATAAPTTNQGPTLLEERPLLGIFVHLLGLATSVFAPAVVYLVSDDEFTRRNARNATNWQLLVLVVTVGSIFGMFGAIALANQSLPDAVSVPDALAVPDALGQVAGLALAAGAVAVMGALTILFLLNICLPLIATGKAIFGEAWAYPVAPDAIGWIATRTAGRTMWPLVLLGYALATPLTAATHVPLVLGYEGFVILAALLTLGLMGGAAVATAALVRDAQDLAETNASWQPNWLPFLGVPIVAGVAIYLAAEPLWGSANPSGDGVYAFMLVLWLSTVVYLLVRHRRVEHR